MIMKKFNVNNLKKQVGIENEDEWDNDFASTPSSTIITKTVVEEKLISVVNAKKLEKEVAASSRSMPSIENLKQSLKVSALARKGFNSEETEKWKEMNNRILIQDANKPWECIRGQSIDRLYFKKSMGGKFI